MKLSHKLSIATAKKLKKDRLKSQTIQVDKDWSIVRIDDYNWGIRHRNMPKFKKWYFGSLLGALKALPATMLQESAKNSLQEVVASHRAILETIETTLMLKLTNLQN